MFNNVTSVKSSNISSVIVNTTQVLRILTPQVTYYQEYVQSCVSNLSKGGKTKKGDRRKTAKYSAQKLYEKGVLVEIEKVPVSSFKAVTIEFSTTDEVGTFEVSGKLSGFNIDKINVVFENLLQVTSLIKIRVLISYS